jgi:hypothetical protein
MACLQDFRQSLLEYFLEIEETVPAEGYALWVLKRAVKHSRGDSGLAGLGTLIA